MQTRFSYSLLGLCDYTSDLVFNLMYLIVDTMMT
jgi:hypothetical protein